MKIVVRPAAAADIEDAYRWYRGKGSELGAQFLAAIKDAGAKVADNPKSY